jgi:hypothetical protein
LIVDISDFLNPEPCRAWGDLRLAYRTIYRPLIAPLRLRIPGAVLDGVRRGYRLVRRLRGSHGERNGWRIRARQAEGRSVAD